MASSVLGISLAEIRTAVELLPASWGGDEAAFAILFFINSMKWLPCVTCILKRHKHP